MDKKYRIDKNKIKTFLLIILVLFIIDGFVIRNISFVPMSIFMKNYSSSRLRIFCIILTTPQYFDTRARAVNLTWAPRCNRYFFISEYSNDTKGLPIAPIALIGNLSKNYRGLTLKTTLAFHYVYENFRNDYDWVIKADDDTYLFIDNLKLFLKDKNSSEPITFGQNFKTIVKKGFHSGGAGYVLSREAVKRFYQAHKKPNTTCVKDGGAEDVEIAKCLRTVGVYPGKSVDEHNRERFHSVSFATHFNGKFGDWFYILAENKPASGANCCSDTTISFHYVTPDEQYLIDKVRYGFHSKT